VDLGGQNAVYEDPTIFARFGSSSSLPPRSLLAAGHDYAFMRASSPVGIDDQVMFSERHLRLTAPELLFQVVAAGIHNGWRFLFIFNRG
jgi:hypothetical protein